MTPDEFRRFALRFKDAFEHAHFGHPDFRVGSRIFATLGYPDIDFGVVKLTPEQQQLFMAAAPDAFSPSKGAWGAGGSTLVRLAAVAPAMLQDALNAAWHDAVAKSTSKRTTTKRATKKRTTAQRTTTDRAKPKRATTKRTKTKRATSKRATAKRAPAKRAKTSTPSSPSPQPSRKAPPPPRKRPKQRRVTGSAR
jgi:hypothetical protein